MILVTFIIFVHIAYILKMLTTMTFQHQICHVLALFRKISLLVFPIAQTKHTGTSILLVEYYYIYLVKTISQYKITESFISKSIKRLKFIVTQDISHLKDIINTIKSLKFCHANTSMKKKLSYMIII